MAFQRVFFISSGPREESNAWNPWLLNSKLFGTGVVCNVPAVSLFMEGGELAPVIVDALNNVATFKPVPTPTLELLMLKQSVAVICVMLFWRS